MRLHHVQVSCPPGGEDAARAFWVGCLGLEEVAKPAALAGRGGCWFRAYDDSGATSAEIHVGVEDPLVPARKAHPALVLDAPDALAAVARSLREAGHPVDDSQRDTFPGFVRLHTADPCGNRVELLAPRGEGSA